jgi:N-acetylmuramoyl-L-alanine amidase
MKYSSINSTNFDKKSRKSENVKFIIIHYTGMQSKRVSIERLTNKKYKVSCHYLIDRKGQILQMVDENKVAWHAGKSKWKNQKNLNKNSIGIELINKGHNLYYESFPKKQIFNLVKLCKKIKKKYKIKNNCILGHSDIAPLRKLDPGEKFPWDVLSKKGLGIKKMNFKNKKFFEEKKNFRKIFFKNIFKIGYRYFDVKKKSKSDTKIIKAFQSKFAQDRVSGKIDKKTLIISHFLAKNA